MLELRPRSGRIGFTPHAKTSRGRWDPQTESFRQAEKPKSMYVYLTSGGIDVVPAVSRVALTENRMLLLRNGRTVADYPRYNVYFASRNRECPPGP